MEDFKDYTSFKDFPTAEELPPREPGRKQPSALKPILFVILIIGIMVLAYLALAKARDIWPFGNNEETSDNGQICIQVITRAKNPKTGEVRDFPTPCDVPEGWEIITPETVDGTENWKTYRNEEFGFEVKYPSDWELSIRQDFYKKVREIFFSNFDFDVEKQYFAYPEESNQLFSIFIDDLSYYQSFLEKNKNSIIDNSPAVRSEVKEGDTIYIEESEVVASGILTYTRIVTVKNNLYYLLQISPHSESSIANFNQILSTFKFVDLPR